MGDKKPESIIKGWPKWLVDTLPLVYVTLIFGTPLVAVTAMIGLNDGPGTRTLLILVSPLIYAVLFMLTAGILSRPHQVGIISGRFPRDSGHPVYGHRKLYGLCWTALYYFKPVYWICLSLPLLKRLTFRLFGYRGSLEFTVYPDTWIRDLPLLTIGEGAYLSNRATLGSNMVMPGNEILVYPIVIGKRSIIGHLACMAGVDIGDDVVVGINSTIGSHVILHDGAQISPCCAIDHGTEVGQGARVGTRCYTGLASRVDPGANLPPHTTLKSRSRFKRTEACSASTQEE